jgi:hypothetical protein
MRVKDGIKLAEVGKLKEPRKRAEGVKTEEDRKTEVAGRVKPAQRSM